MEINGRRILLCDCEHSMTLDGKALAKACGAEGATRNRQPALPRADR